MSKVNYEVRVRAWSLIGPGKYSNVTPTGTVTVGTLSYKNKLLHEVTGYGCCTNILKNIPFAM